MRSVGCCFPTNHALLLAKGARRVGEGSIELYNPTTEIELKTQAEQNRRHGYLLPQTGGVFGSCCADVWCFCRLSVPFCRPRPVPVVQRSVKDAAADLPTSGDIQALYHALEGSVVLLQVRREQYW